MALKSHLYADVSEISIFSADPLSWKIFTWVSEKSETQCVWSPQYFLRNCYTQLPLSQLVASPNLWSNSHRTTGKTTALTLWTYGSKGMSLLFNILSRLVIAFLPKSKCLLISWLQSPSTMILVLKKRKSTTASTLPPSICHKVMGLDATIFGSVSQLCLTPWNPMDCSTPGFPVHHQLPELAQTHVHWVSDTIQPSHPLLSPSPPAFNLSQHQGLFQWISSSHQVAKVLEL